MYSQNDEEKFILEYFGDTVARFYDIGAWSGVRLSNTYALLQRGWSGTLVEPEFNAFAALTQNLREHAARTTLVNAAIALEAKLTKFWSSKGDAVSTFDEAHRDKWNDAVGGMDLYWIMPITPAQLFATFGEAEFISLDVEGTNWPIFQQIPFAEWPTLRMVCVEHDNHADAMLAHATQFGFKEITRNPENLIIAR